MMTRRLQLLSLCRCVVHLIHPPVSPVVNVTNEVVYTGPSQSVSVECLIESEPEAEVFWYHNNSEILERNLRRNLRRGQSHLPQIRT